LLSARPIVSETVIAAPAYGTPTLSVSGICKRFGGIQALDDVHMETGAGEVMALIGENGAGKSTLVKILTGIYPPDSGEILLGGARQTFANAHVAGLAGITAIHQEALLFEDLTVAENILVGHLPRRRPVGAIDWRATRQRAAAHLRQLGAEIDPDALVRGLSIAERHMITVAKALAQDAKVVIFDEPTAALSENETQYLYGIIRSLKANGKAIIFISHKFDEVFAIADRYTVLRDGRFVASGRIADASQAELVRMMVGRPVSQIYPKADTAIGDVVLRAEGLSHPTEFRDISFTVRRSEILGFYGLVGAGRTEVMEAIFGLKPLSAGSIAIEGSAVNITGPGAAMQAGIVYVPEDRQQHGGILPMTVRSNISLASLGRVSRGLFLSPRREEALAELYGRRLAIKASSWSQRLEQLSGGNQQKVVISKWLATDPRIIIFDEPTKGIDIGSKAAVHEFIGDLVRSGVSVILVSSELDEVLGLADRMIVMHHGLVRGRFERGATREEIVHCAAGSS
jgi:rhamnose transport system ATP-binding protein